MDGWLVIIVDVLNYIKATTLNVTVFRIVFTHWYFYHVYGRRFIYINNHKKMANC